MKVLFISRVTLPEGVRGNAQGTLSCVRGIRQKGHAVRLAITEGLVKNLPKWDAPAQPEEFTLVRELLQAEVPDLLLVNYSYLAPLLALAPPGCVRAVMTHDARHLRHQDFLAKGCASESSPWTADQEREALAFAELVIASQESEAVEFRRLAPHAQTVTVPCCFPLERLPLPENQRSCLFVGSDADHNIHGLHWFLDAVWPEVLERCPEAELNICGTICQRLKREAPGMRLHGRVEDLRPHFLANAVGVVPLLVGSGCKLKLVETLSKGRPCVATSTGMQGLAPSDGGVVLADDPAAFAEALAELFTRRDWLEAQAQAAFAHASRRFNPDASHGQLWQALKILGVKDI